MRNAQLQVLAMLVMLQVPTAVVAQCPGRESPDFGYGWSQSDKGFMGFRVDRVQYARHLSPPILHQIDPRGPGAGRLMEGDTLITIGGFGGTTEEAEVLLRTADAEPITLTVGRAGGRRSFTITPRRICYLDANKFQLSWMGFSILCDGCSAGANPNGSMSWSFPQSPVVADVEPGSPAARAGLMKRDTLVAIDGLALRTPRGGARLGSVEIGQSVVWTVRRNGKTETIKVVASTIHNQ